MGASSSSVNGSPSLERMSSSWRSIRVRERWPRALWRCSCSCLAWALALSNVCFSRIIWSSSDRRATVSSRRWVRTSSNSLLLSSSRRTADSLWVLSSCKSWISSLYSARFAFCWRTSTSLSSSLWLARSSSSWMKLMMTRTIVWKASSMRSEAVWTIVCSSVSHSPLNVWRRSWQASSVCV